MASRDMQHIVAAMHCFAPISELQFHAILGLQLSYGPATAVADAHYP